MMFQATLKTALTEVAIKKYMKDEVIYQLRDPRYPLYIRFNQKRTQGSYFWVNYSNNSQKSIKLGSYPTLKPKDLLKQMSQIQLHYRLKGQIQHDTQATVHDVLSWYLDRVVRSGAYSQSRRSSVQSLVKLLTQYLSSKLLVIELSEQILDKTLVSMRSLYTIATTKAAFGTLKAALKQAKQLKVIATDPMAQQYFKHYLSESVKTKDCALSLDDLHAIDLTLAKRQQKMLFLMLALFGTRLGETRQTRWQDISFEHKTWTIPASHTKTNKELILPLTQQAIRLFKIYKLQAKSPYLFSSRKGGVLSHTSAHAMIIRLSKGQWTAHDIRKRFRSILADLGIDYYVSESLLNHAKGKLDQAYIHTHLENLKQEALKSYHVKLSTILDLNL
tara:strand:- start:1900 stop:3066 length:1167 start_codon:yes stop_codon:yes gene_type:complete